MSYMLMQVLLESPQLRESVEMDFGTQMKTLREMKNLTQYALAQKTQISLSMITHYELNVKSPSYTDAERIAKALDVSLERFSYKHNEITRKRLLTGGSIMIEVTEKKVNLSVDGIVLDDEEIDMLISFVREDRRIRQM